MNTTSLITDNITEVLVKIIEFTQTRQKILIQNINGVRSSGFIPKDLAVEEFCALLGYAIDEHIRHRQLVLCDTENIKFGVCGSFKVKPMIDEYAKELLEYDKAEYLELQRTKLLENSLNQRVAAELLKQKQKNDFNFRTAFT